MISVCARAYRRASATDSDSLVEHGIHALDPQGSTSKKRWPGTGLLPRLGRCWKVRRCRRVLLGDPVLLYGPI